MNENLVSVWENVAAAAAVAGCSSLLQALSLPLSVNTHKHVATFVAHSLSLNLSLVCGDVAVAAALLLQKNFYNKNLYS